MKLANIHARIKETIYNIINIVNFVYDPKIGKEILLYGENETNKVVIRFDVGIAPPKFAEDAAIVDELRSGCTMAPKTLLDSETSEILRTVEKKRKTAKIQKLDITLNRFGFKKSIYKL